MRWFACAGAALCLVASHAAAATYTFSDTLAAGTSRTYVFDAPGAYAFSAGITDHYTWYFPIPVPDGHGGFDYSFLDSEQSDLIADCSSTCSDVDGIAGGYIKIQAALLNGVLTVIADNRTSSFFDCSGLTSFEICGYSFKPAQFGVSIDAFGAVSGPTITSGAVPEPGTWALMILGFGLAGAGLRQRRAREAVAA